MYITIRETANRLHVSTKTITRRIADGSLRAYKVGKSVRIAEADLAECLSASQQATK